MTPVDDTLVYMALGDGPHAHEIAFSVYSVIRFCGGGASARPRIVVYTDRPSAFAGLPIATRVLTDHQRRDWCGPQDYVYRFKLCALRDALGVYGGRCIYLDSDTYFIRSPSRLFESVRRGRSVMHRREGTLYAWGGGIAKRLEGKWSAFVALDGQPWMVSPYSVAFNAGVIGLHVADGRVLDEAIYLSDALHAQTGHYLSEQTAVSLCLARWTPQATAFRTVYHYWYPPTKAAFRAVLPQHLEQFASLSSPKREEWLYERRPLEPLRWRSMRRVKELIKAAGVFPDGIYGPDGRRSITQIWGRRRS